MMMLKAWKFLRSGWSRLVPGFGGLILAVATVVSGCASVPSGMKPVTSFQPEKYLGRWYEIARMDHSFERHLTHVSATYTELPGERIEVVNRGYDTNAGRWKEIRGKAKPAGDPETGSLLVSFFPPFSAGYHVFALDRQDYQWALVAGPNRKYLWVLSRRPSLSPSLKQKLYHLAAEAGYDTGSLISVPQTSPPGSD